MSQETLINKTNTSSFLAPQRDCTMVYATTYVKNLLVYNFRHDSRVICKRPGKKSKHTYFFGFLFLLFFMTTISVIRLMIIKKQNPITAISKIMQQTHEHFSKKVCVTFNINQAKACNKYVELQLQTIWKDSCSDYPKKRCITLNQMKIPLLFTISTQSLFTNKANEKSLPWKMNHNYIITMRRNFNCIFLELCITLYNGLKYDKLNNYWTFHNENVPVGCVFPWIFDYLKS